MKKYFFFAFLNILFYFCNQKSLGKVAQEGEKSLEKRA